MSARSDYGVGHPYVATKQSADNFMIDKVQPKLITAYIIFVLPFLIIDFGLSVVTDTVLFPADIIITPKSDIKDTNSTLKL